MARSSEAREDAVEIVLVRDESTAWVKASDWTGSPVALAEEMAFSVREEMAFCAFFVPNVRPSSWRR